MFKYLNIQQEVNNNSNNPYEAVILTKYTKQKSAKQLVQLGFLAAKSKETLDLDNYDEIDYNFEPGASCSIL